MLKSNSSINEYLQSPIHYIENKNCENDLLYLVISQFNPSKVAMHYLGITTKRLIELENVNQIKLKSLFYALRSVLSAKWIVETQTIPPMEFKKLIHLINDKSIAKQIEKYRLLKETVDEKFLITKDYKIFNWILDLKESLKSRTNELSKVEFNKEKINDFFIKTIK